MKDIKPILVEDVMLCSEKQAEPCSFVVFGASGDLVRRKLLVSLFEIFNKNLMDENFYVLGCGRKDISDDKFRADTAGIIENKFSNCDKDRVRQFIEKLYFLTGEYDNETFYENIKAKTAELDIKHNVNESVIFYLSVPPFLYGSIAENLGKSGLSRPDCGGNCNKIRLVVEKPFGRDTKSAAELNSKIRKYFEESQIYRIDHYLGKETVQNILMFRFANTIFEPVWNRDYIDSVQITIAEELGVEHRAGYYDRSGALRDMFQNHMLQMLSLVAMEPPASFEADSIRDEKIKLLRSIRKFDSDSIDKDIVRGQYGPGKFKGYRQEDGIADDSVTETFVAAKFFVDNWRWQGVPFYLRTGKAMAGKDTEIAVFFKKVPHSMFISAGIKEIPANVLVLQIQPEEAISLSFQTKHPGSKMCMSRLNMHFDYNSVFGIEMPEAYQRLLLDCMAMDQTLFARFDGVQAAWKLLTGVLEKWALDKTEPYIYPSGSESFEAADKIIESDGRKWRPLTVKGA